METGSHLVDQVFAVLGVTDFTLQDCELAHRQGGPGQTRPSPVHPRTGLDQAGDVDKRWRGHDFILAPSPSRSTRIPPVP